MRTPKPLYVQQRRIYHPELMSCLSCDDLLVGCHYLKWDKIVQTLDQVLSIASRPGYCPNPKCAGHARRLLSAQGQGIALANSTYGYDAVTRIGWLRQHRFATYEQIHADLTYSACLSGLTLFQTYSSIRAVVRSRKTAENTSPLSSGNSVGQHVVTLLWAICRVYSSTYLRIYQ